MKARAPLLLYLASAADPQRTAVGPVLAAAAERAGWGFECYYDELRRGRHFGGGDIDAARPGWPGGSLVVGGGHLDRILWLSTAWEIAAAGDPDSVLWPALEAAACEEIVRSSDPAVLFEAVFGRLGAALPKRAVLLDASPRGPERVVTAPYLAPELLTGEPRLALEASGDRAALERLGVIELEPVAVEAGSYTDLSAAVAGRFGSWAEGVLLGDPALVAAQLPRIRRLRLLPLYGRPQVETIARAAGAIRAGRDPVYGRQYDDRDFLELSRLGRGLQVVDPGPPFDAERAVTLTSPEPAAVTEPSDEELGRWADEGRILVTLLFWTGMIRELDCFARTIDIAAETGVAAGLLSTAETIELAGPLLPPLTVAQERGGVAGLLELLLASTGRGVGAEALLPDGVLAGSLTEARAAAASRLPDALAPTGWWPLLDAPLVHEGGARFRLEGRRPVAVISPRGQGGQADAPTDEPAEPRRDVRALAGTLVRRTKLERLFAEQRPYERDRPGALDERVPEAVRQAGFDYMWTKTGFGRPRVVRRDGTFVALSLTAGNWDGWSPFYTVASARDLARAERRLRRTGGPGWLVGTVDSPLWLLSGELLEHGGRIHSLARLAAGGGRSGELLNVTPRVIARYARLLDDRGLLE